jgi:YidC/Oxa1 family membrane protein insertase
MSGFLGVPVDAAYHLVSPFVSFLTPLLGGLAAAAAIVGFTVVVRLLLLPLSYRAMRGMAAQARMAPLAQGLRKRYAGQPDRLQRELTALYRAEGTSMFAGCLPLLVQWPAFSVLSLLFRSQQVGGAPNTLLTHRLFGAPLASYWLGGAGPFSVQGAVFAGLFVLLAAVGWLSARMARRASGPAGPAGTRRPSGTSAADTTATGAAAASGAQAALARVLPFATVAIAAFVPLAAGLYLATSTAWTLAERAVLGRSLALRPGAHQPGAHQPGAHHQPGARHQPAG